MTMVMVSRRDRKKGNIHDKGEWVALKCRAVIGKIRRANVQPAGILV
jgi:hypothetical protein